METVALDRELRKKFGYYSSGELRNKFGNYKLIVNSSLEYLIFNPFVARYVMCNCVEKTLKLKFIM